MDELVFVGTGDAFGSGGRRNSAILLRSGGRSLLMDCGPTTTSGLKSLAIDPRDVDSIVVSHFHGDHLSGIPFLLLDYLFENVRSKPLTIWGPPGIQQRVERIASDFEYTLHTPGSYPLEFREFATDETFEVEGLRVTPTSAHHNPSTHPHMLRVDTPRRSLFYSGDTGWHDELPQKVGDVDLFICECVFIEDGQFALHMSVRELDRARHLLRCGDIRLTHLGSEVLANLDRVPYDTADDGLRLKL